ncbi:hypothetical protein [Chimaeribacter coloradensis]|uniref:hypothetical protein n=1 Tax=Chimaeribacter coloradensis TaxID=2060068 RepID=UPI0013FD00C4|nr:hypothetical protein [Chimaeribacter coloradensis]
MFREDIGIFFKKAAGTQEGKDTAVNYHDSHLLLSSAKRKIHFLQTGKIIRTHGSVNSEKIGVKGYNFRIYRGFIYSGINNR